jgi:sirohydrochlorin ferrochelatase
MTGPALLAVAHGSQDPRAEPVLDALIARLRSERPGLVAVLAHLGHTAPDVASSLDTLGREGVHEVVVLPLLLTSAYHARVDLPALLSKLSVEHPDMTITQGGVLGPHALLFDLVRRRLLEAGVDRDAAVVLGAIGTSDAGANAELADVAATLGATIGFATRAPAINDVVAQLRRTTQKQIAVAAYVLSPGQLPDRFHDAGADVVTEVLGAGPELIELILHRYDEVLRSSNRLIRSA